MMSNDQFLRSYLAPGLRLRDHVLEPELGGGGGGGGVGGGGAPVVTEGGRTSNQLSTTLNAET